MPSQATVEVTLPPAPKQAIAQTNRVVTVTGSLADGSQDVAIESSAPLTIKAAIGSAVTIAVSEVLSNGKQSPPCALAFTPADHVEAVAADPSGFAVKVVAVEEVA